MFQLHGRWKHLSMVQKYQRDWTFLTTGAVAELFKDLRSSWREDDAEPGHLRCGCGSFVKIRNNLFFQRVIMVKFMTLFLLHHQA